MTVKRCLERFAPIVVSVLGTVLIVWHMGGLTPEVYGSVRSNFTASALSISTTMLGFLLTIYTVIQSINTPGMQSIRANRAYPRLLGFLRGSLYAHAFVIMLVLAFTFPSLADLHWQMEKPKIDLKVWSAFVFAVLWAVTTTVRFVPVFLDLIEESNPPSKDA